MALALFTHLWTTQSLVRHQIHISIGIAIGMEQNRHPSPKRGLYPSTSGPPTSLMSTAAVKSSGPEPDPGSEITQRRHLACTLHLVTLLWPPIMTAPSAGGRACTSGPQQWVH